MKREIPPALYAILGAAILLAVFAAGCTGSLPSPPATPLTTAATAAPATPATVAPPATPAPTASATQSPTTVATTPAAPATAATTPAPPAPVGVTITIQNLAFLPQTVTVPRGTNVTWINLDTIQYQVANSGTETLGPGLLFRSNPLGKGDSFSYTFTNPGTFRYTCIIHPYMWGAVIVT